MNVAIFLQVDVSKEVQGHLKRQDYSETSMIATDTNLFSVSPEYYVRVPESAMKGWLEPESEKQHRDSTWLV